MAFGLAIRLVPPVSICIKPIAHNKVLFIPDHLMLLARNLHFLKAKTRYLLCRIVVLATN